MTQVPVNEPAEPAAASPPSADAPAASSAGAGGAQSSSPRRRSRWFRYGLPALLGAVVIVALAWFLVLPWLLRNRVQATLRGAGVTGITFDVARATPWGSTLTDVQAGSGDALGIDRIALDYSLLDLVHGRLHAIHIRGGRLELRAHNGQVDLSPLTAFVFGKNRPTTRAGASTEPTELPVEEIDLTDSRVVLQTDTQTVEIPVDLAVQNRGVDQLLLAAHVGPEKNLRLNASIDLAKSSATFDGAADPGWTLLTARAIWPAAQVGVGGQLKFGGSAMWAGTGPPTGEMKLEIGSAAASASPTTAPAAKLQVARGVFQVAGQFGAQPTVRLDVKDAALAMADQFSVAGVAGAIRFSDLSPAQTPPGQRLIASSLKVGPLELTDGAVEFQVTGSTLNVRQTQWLAFGGSVWASDVAIAPGAPIKATLHASNIDLKSLLDAFAQGKASGEGRISGELPVVINGSNVEFGDGHATSSGGGGMVQVKDRSTLAAVAAGAGASAGNLTQKEQLERNIVEALSDFQYDQLTTRLDSRPGGQLDAHIRMSGHGRTGAKQALDYELNVNRLDLAIKSYFGVNQAMNAPKNAATRATGKALTP